MADEVDRINLVSTENMVQSALTSVMKRLRQVHGDYSVWDDAFVGLYGSVDHAFVASNIEQSTKTSIMFDGAYLLDEQRQAVFGFERGNQALRDPFQEFGPSLRTLMGLVARNYHAYDAQVGVVVDQTGEIAVVAVGSILPTTESIPSPTQPRLLVLVRYLNAAKITELGRDFSIPGLTLTVASSMVPGAQGVPVRNPDGEIVGFFTWNAQSPGHEAFARIAPTAFLMMALIGLTTLFLLATGYRNFVDLRRRERLALHAAHHDSLTGLPNRSAMMRALEQAVQARARSGAAIAILYLDLDGFKEVNDAYGHATGDRLLQHVSEGFATICGDAGLLARIGGDEFALLVDNKPSLMSTFEIGEALVAFFDEPIRIDGRSVSIGTSIGIALADDGPVDAGELLRRADVAMYVAKNLGRNRVAVYDSSIDAARAERLRLADDLRGAIAADALEVVYQPIFDVATMRPSGVEALLRWLHPVDGLIPPDRFIPIAEESGLIEEIGAWVLQRACRDALDWPADVHLSVNVSPVQFRNPRFDSLLAELLRDTGFPPSRLEIEMTETHLVGDPERAQLLIESIRALGVTISLDDFGTGYSSIGYLRRFSFDKLKLDRSLVHGIVDDPAARSLCEATITLGRSLGLVITAEGVETHAEADILRKAGCDALQGYAFARPMTIEAVGGFLTVTMARPVVMPAWVV